MLVFLYYALLILMYVVRIYTGMLFIYCLLTWIPDTMGTKLGQLLARAVEPFLNIFDRFIPAVGGIGFSALIAGFFLYLVQRGIVALMMILLGM